MSPITKVILGVFSSNTTICREMDYWGHKWQLRKRKDQRSNHIWTVELHYWDRRNNCFYSVWLGQWNGEELHGVFRIKRSNRDFTPVSKKHVNELIKFITNVLEER